MSVLMNHFKFLEIHKRLELLENKVFKNKRKTVTMGKKLLLLKELGFIEKFQIRFKTKEDMYSFLSIILDEDSINIKKYLNNRKLLEIEENSRFIFEVSKKLKLEDLAKSAELKLENFKKKG